MDRRHFLKAAAAATALAGAAPLAWAQDAATYPNRGVTLVVPFSAGSMTDILARSVAEKLSERWKQNVVVENRPGIAGTAGVAKAPADGTTIMLTSNGHTVIKAINPNVTFDPVKDFAGCVDPLHSHRAAGWTVQDAEGSDRGRQGEAGGAQLQFGRARQLDRDRRRAAEAGDEDPDGRCAA